MNPEVLAVRTVNQYRRRDVLAYIGLRYYLENQSTLSDRWARTVSTHLVNTRATPTYFRSYHFKELDEDRVIHRNMFLPGPNEALAEAALLNECSKYSEFRSASCVYSYRFPHFRSKEGVFQNYFYGFQERHKSIASACHSIKDAVVCYTDIKKFYPRIPKELAFDAWKTACDSSNISSEFRETGERLLKDQNITSAAYGDGLGILIGPMFSHLIANLILGDIDNTMYEKMEGRYTRYVDDIVLIGNNEQIPDARNLLSKKLGEMGFLLHDDRKDFQVNSESWLEGAEDFDGTTSKEWINLIANIKRFLIAKPDQRYELQNAFLENGINLPLLDYSNAVLESSYLRKFSDRRRKYDWSIKAIHQITIQTLLEGAIHTREVYEKKISNLLDERPDVEGFARKRLVPKLRFYAGRLIFLCLPNSLLNISSALENYPELLLQANIMRAIQSRDISPLLRLGANAVQAASQVLRLDSNPVKCSLSTFGDVELQGLATLRLNGIEIEFKNDIESEIETNPLNYFSIGKFSSELMKSDDPFIKEIACLRGTEDVLRHKLMLEMAFDRDEHLILDVINQLRDSS